MEKVFVGIKKYNELIEKVCQQIPEGTKYVYGVPRGGVLVAMSVAKETGLEVVDDFQTEEIINNMVVGTTTGFTKELQIVGTGYRSSIQGKQLVLNVGYSLPHPIDIPDTIKVELDQKGLNIKITGADKQEVGQFAAIVREERMPEPYKQKGIRYKDEYIIKKQGKRGTK